MDADEFLANQTNLGTPYTLGAVTGRGTRTRLMMSQHVEIGGRQFTWSTNFSVSKLEVPVAPGQGALITVAGKEFRIFAVADTAISWVLSLAHPDFAGRA